MNNQKTHKFQKSLEQDIQGKAKEILDRVFNEVREIKSIYTNRHSLEAVFYDSHNLSIQEEMISLMSKLALANEEQLINVFLTFEQQESLVLRQKTDFCNKILARISKINRSKCFVSREDSDVNFQITDENLIDWNIDFTLKKLKSNLKKAKIDTSLLRKLDYELFENCSDFMEIEKKKKERITKSVTPKRARKQVQLF